MNRLVSIGLPTRNRASVIRPLLDSLLAQDYRNFELIISDNASNDETPQVLEEYAARDARIRWIRQSENLGLIGNQNFVFAQARGEYFVWSGDDDIYEPDFLSQLAAVLDADPRVVLAYCPLDWIDDQDRLVDRAVTPYHREPAPTPVAEILRQLWDEQGWGKFIGMFRTDVLRRCAPMVYNHGTQTDYSDLALCFEMSFHGALVGVPKIMLHKRIGGASMQPLYYGIFYHLNRLYHIERQFSRRLRRAPLPWQARMRVQWSVWVRMADIMRSWRSGLLKSLLFTFIPPPLRVKLARARQRRREPQAGRV